MKTVSAMFSRIALSDTQSLNLFDLFAVTARAREQGFWMATQEQLKYLQRQCQYLKYTDKSALPFVEKFSGSLEQFSPACHTTKASVVFLTRVHEERTG